MLEAGFNLISWSSNSSKVRDLAMKENVMDADENTKILGMSWNHETDEIFYPKRKIAVDTRNTTKREILKHTSKIYDPLGLLSLVTIQAKLLLQKLWKDKYNWNEPLPDAVCKKWSNIVTDIDEATTISFPRSYIMNIASLKLLSSYCFYSFLL